MKKILNVILTLVLPFSISVGQQVVDNEVDKCGVYTEEMKTSGSYPDAGWGYTYNDLLNDLISWENSEYVTSLSLGKTIQAREIYELTITDLTISESKKKRIYIHSRTHPNEVQSFHVTDEIINFLTAESGIGKYLRERCIFHVVPMYNPDGVELEYGRENANKVDIESNWNKETLELEVENLQRRFVDLMKEEKPIELALNMHSAVACKRYFVFHHANGTSSAFANLQKLYIENVRARFYEGIQPHDYFVSWTNSTPTQYPESWWWLNHKESVLALTYEDMNCSSAGYYDKTAFSILHGVSDYFDLGFTSSTESHFNRPIQAMAFPNPFSTEVFIEWNNFKQPEGAIVSDMFGRRVRVFSKAETQNGSLIWDGTDNKGSEMPAGTYILQLLVKGQATTVLIVKQ